MSWKTKVWQLSQSEQLSSHFADAADLDKWISGCVESYLICRQRAHGDVHPERPMNLNFQDAHEHIYAKDKGCSWCRKRVQAKMWEWLRRKQDSTPKPDNKQPFVISLS